MNQLEPATDGIPNFTSAFDMTRVPADIELYGFDDIHIVPQFVHSVPLINGTHVAVQHQHVGISVFTPSNILTFTPHDVSELHLLSALPGFPQAPQTKKVHGKYEAYFQGHVPKFLDPRAKYEIDKCKFAFIPYVTFELSTLPISTRIVYDNSPAGHRTIMITENTPLRYFQLEGDFHLHTDLINHWRQANVWKLRAQASPPPWNERFDPDCMNAAMMMFNHLWRYSEEDAQLACELLDLAETLEFPPLDTISIETATVLERLLHDHIGSYRESELDQYDRILEKIEVVFEREN
jgi:hypothetical protein